MRAQEFLRAAAMRMPGLTNTTLLLPQLLKKRYAVFNDDGSLAELKVRLR